MYVLSNVDLQTLYKINLVLHLVSFNYLNLKKVEDDNGRKQYVTNTKEEFIGVVDGFG